MNSKKVLAIKEATEFLVKTMGYCSLGSSCPNQQCEKLHRPESGKKICPFVENEKCVCLNCLGSLENGTHKFPIIGRRQVCWHGRICQHESCVFWHPETKVNPNRIDRVSNVSSGNMSGVCIDKRQPVENKVSVDLTNMALNDTLSKIDILEDTMKNIIITNKHLISELSKIRAALEALSNI